MNVINSLEEFNAFALAHLGPDAVCAQSSTLEASYAGDAAYPLYFAIDGFGNIVSYRYDAMWVYEFNGAQGIGESYYEALENCKKDMARIYAGMGI